MMRTPLVVKLAVAATLAAAALVAFAPSVCSSGPIGLSGDLGFGTTRFEGSSSGSSVSSWGLGLGLPLGPASWVELRSTGTGNPFEHTVDAGTPGARAVNTLTAGFQFAPPLPFTPFLGAGLGVGRSESASGGAVVGPTSSRAPVTTRERTAAAYSLALGYRFANGLGPTHFEVAFRTHGLIDREMSSSDFARVVTFGIHF